MVADTHYRLLEVQPTATLSEIKQAYRRLVKLFHPDLQRFTLDSDNLDLEKIVHLNAAYEVLSDPERRKSYDASLNQVIFPDRREQRRANVQRQHQNTYQPPGMTQWEIQVWISEVYVPLRRLLLEIIKPLNQKIDDLAADPFDDRLMNEFLGYLDYCRALLESAHHVFSSQPNPVQVAQAAANLYYCLNHLGDGLEDFSLFTLGYDDRHLHTGRELWRLAQQRLRETQQQLNFL